MMIKVILVGGPSDGKRMNLIHPLKKIMTTVIKPGKFNADYGVTPSIVKNNWYSLDNSPQADGTWFARWDGE